MKLLTIAIPIIFLLACTKAASPSLPPPPAPPSLRFEIVQLGTFRRDQFLLDKETGQIWGKVCLVPGKGGADCEYLAWMKDDIESINIARKDMIDLANTMESNKKNSARK